MYTFHLNENEKAKLFAWRAEHVNTCNWFKSPLFATYRDAMGGLLTYSFKPSHVGCTVEVKCECGESIDVTDYKSW